MSTSLQVAIDELRKAFPPYPLDPARAFGDNGTTKRAVARALEALEIAEELEHNQRDIAEVLNSYWRNLIGRSEKI